MEPYNIFVIGLNDFNLRKLEKLDREGRYAFHNLLGSEDILDAEVYDIEPILAKAREELNAFEAGPDAILGYMDFPVSTIVPILSKEYGLRSTSLESLLKCEHKYWSRLEQQKAIPDHIPSFRLFDPFDADAFDKIDIPLPYWVKPIKSFASYLGFRINSKAEFERAQEAIKKGIHRVGDAFGKVTRMVELPEPMQATGPTSCIAESLIGGNHQCTLEGAVHEGNIYFHGMVDSVRVPGTSVFERYEYPSDLPAEVQKNMERIAAQFIEQVGYNDAGFNIEFFWDEEKDQVWFLEINTRVAQHHSDLFEKVDGVPNQKAALDVGMGREPVFPHREGDFAKAACFFIRETEDRYVASIPSQENLRALEAEHSGAVIQLQVKPGIWLSQLVEQDSYSYITAIVYVGGDSTEELLEQKAAIEAKLGIEYKKERPADA